MDFEHVQVTVDSLGQAEFLREQMNGADATARDAMVARRHLEIDVAPVKAGSELLL